MQRSFRKSLLDNVIVLILLGILAGGLAGLGIGMIQKKSTTPASAGR